MQTLQLISNNGDRHPDPYEPSRDNGEPLGFGIAWMLDGVYCRTGVLLPRNPTEKDVLEAWDLLAKAVANPSPATCVYDTEALRGREQRVSSLDNTTK